MKNYRLFEAGLGLTMALTPIAADPTPTHHSTAETCLGGSSPIYEATYPFWAQGTEISNPVDRTRMQLVIGQAATIYSLKAAAGEKAWFVVSTDITPTDVWASAIKTAAWPAALQAQTEFKGDVSRLDAPEQPFIPLWAGDLDNGPDNTTGITTIKVDAPGCGNQPTEFVDPR